MPLDLLSRAVERAKGLRLIILDACRDNPFAVAMQRSGATRSIGRGLASVEPSGETLVAYSAKEGTVAADGDGRNSPYMTALLAHLEEPGLEVGLMFRKVRDAVLASTGGRQEPFVYGSLSSEGAYLAARPEPEPAPTPAPETVKGGDDTRTPDSDQVVERRIAAEKELLFWESVKDSEHAADFEAYLKQFPGGTYEALARNRLARLTGKQDEKPVVQVAVTPDEPERVVSPEPAPTAPEVVEASLGLERAERRLIQMGLASLGFDPGPADGLFGRRTRTAIGDWQSSEGGEANGHLDAEAAKVLLAAGEEATRKRTEAARKERERQRAEAARKERERQRAEAARKERERQRAEAARKERERQRAEAARKERERNRVHTINYNNGERYVGQLRDGKPHGRGTATNPNGKRYEGQWRDGKFHGHGSLTLGNGNRYVGQFHNNKPHGGGTYIKKNGTRYNGEWRNGCFSNWSTNIAVATTPEACGFR